MSLMPRGRNKLKWTISIKIVIRLMVPVMSSRSSSTLKLMDFKENLFIPIYCGSTALIKPRAVVGFVKNWKRTCNCRWKSFRTPGFLWFFSIHIFYSVKMLPYLSNISLIYCYVFPVMCRTKNHLIIRNKCILINVLNTSWLVLQLKSGGRQIT